MKWQREVSDMEKKIKVSIIVPVYNVEKNIAKCLDSIVSQTLGADGEIEAILVDDGSTDSSGQICDSYAERYSIFKAVHRANYGVAAARNTGMDAAEGEWLAFVDADDYLEADYCEKPYRMGMKENADIVMFNAFREEQTGEKRVTVWGQADCSFNTSNRDDIFALRCKILYPHFKTKIGMVTYLKNEVPLAAPWDKLYRRDFLVSNGLRFSDELKVLDDMFFNYQVFSAAHRVMYFPDPLYHYCIWEDSITNSYKANRPELDQKAFDYIKEEIICGDLDNMREFLVMQAFYARIIKSFAICCRLSFFNKKNTKSGREKLRTVRNYMKAGVYSAAFKKVKFSTIEWKLWLVTIAGRLKSPALLYLLDRLQNR